jgi:hypothetical protein
LERIKKNFFIFVHVYAQDDVLPKMSGGGSGSAAAAADGTTIIERISRQMIGGNTSGVMDNNPWLENKGLIPPDGHVQDPHEPPPLFNVWLPVPVHTSSIWKPLSRSLSDCSFRANDLMRFMLYWLQFLFLAPEISGAPSCSSTGMPEPLGTPSFNVNASRSPKLHEKVLETYCICHGLSTGARPRPEDFKFLQSHTNTVAPMFDSRMVDALKKTAAELDSRTKGKKGAPEDGATGAAGGGTPPPVLDPLQIQLPPLPTDDRDVPEFTVMMDAIFDRFKGQIHHRQLNDAYRRVYRDPDTVVREEETRDARDRIRQRVDRIRMWVKKHLPRRGACSNKRILVDPTDVVYTEYKSRAFLLAIGRRTWPIWKACEYPPVDDEADAQGLLQRDGEWDGQLEGEQQQNATTNTPTHLVMPKVKVTWFVLDDKKNSLFRFSFYDPNLSLMNVYTTATRQPKKKGASRFADFTTDPLEHLRQFGKKGHVANCLNDELFEQMYNFLNPAVKFKSVRHALDDPGDAGHISNALTLKRALEILSCVGANTHAFERFPMDKAKRSFAFPEEPVFKTYVLHPRMCFWYSAQYLGIAYTLWPGVSDQRSDFALALIMGTVKIQNGQIIDNAAAAATQSDQGNRPQMLSDLGVQHSRMYMSPMVDKSDLLTSRPRLLAYETGDQIVLWQAEADAAFRHIRQLLPANPEANPSAYAVYCEAVRRFRSGQLQKFCSIWTLDSTVDNKSISVAHKAVIKYLGNLVLQKDGTTKSVTLRLPFLDEGMTVYGNACIKRMLVLSKVNRIINTKIPFMAGALLSTFDKKRDGEPKVHLSLSGPPAAGKTFPLHFFIKKSFIAGTFEVRRRKKFAPVPPEAVREQRYTSF